MSSQDTRLAYLFAPTHKSDASFLLALLLSFSSSKQRMKQLREMETLGFTSPHSLLRESSMVVIIVIVENIDSGLRMTCLETTLLSLSKCPDTL